MSGSLEGRFHTKYERIPFAGCWIWTGALLSKKSPYGVLVVGTHKSHRNIAAHRLSYELHKGPIPPGMLVCHKCDVPPCVNPDHLFLGTDADNIADRDAKGRHRVRRGEACPWAVLTAGQAMAIRADQRTEREIAKDYRISTSLVGKIRRREAWN